MNMRVTAFVAATAISVAALSAKGHTPVMESIPLSDVMITG